MRRLPALILTIWAALLTIGSSTSASAQPQISYITPDAAAKNMTVVVDMYVNLTTGGNYTDGWFDPNTLVQLQNAGDTASILLGPSIVSWSGRLVQVMLFVQPTAANGTIPLVVKSGSNTSNAVNFHIVTPQAFGAKNGGGVIGGGLGTRTTRNTMVVDSMWLSNGTYTVATSDVDGSASGNQGFLPLRILSAGPIRLTNATINVQGQNASGSQGGDGGPGGGGGGGGALSSGGSGFTGGGGVGDINGTTRKGGAGTGSDPGSPYYNGGSSMNGIIGGLGTEYNNPNANNDEGGGGGTGFPFGTSGTHGLYGSASAAGGYGAGSGGGQGPSGFPFTYATYGGGGGGFGTLGGAGGGSGNNAGQIVGNAMLVPLAGGSGGGSANIWYSSGNSAGNGGGGGGAIELTTFQAFVLPFGGVDAHGGNASNGSGGYPANPSGGGGGSGGAIVIGARDSITIGTAFQSPTLNVAGGSRGSGYNSGGDGGQGRIRLDGRISNQNGNANTSNYFTPSKDYIGPNTSYITSTKTTFVIHGFGKGWVATGDVGNTIRLYYRFPSTGWQLVTVTTSNPGNSRSAAWQTATLARSTLVQDSIVYIAAQQYDPNNTSSGYTAEPVYVMTHTSGMIAHFPGTPRIAVRDTIIDFGKIRVGKCSRDTAIKVYSIGNALLRVDTARISGSGASEFTLNLLDSLRINQSDSSYEHIAFCPKDTGCFTATVTLNSNDTIKTIIVMGCGVQPQIQTITPIDFGAVRLGTCKDTSFLLTNTGNDTLHVTKQLFGDAQFKLVAPPLGYVLKPGASITVTIEYCADDTLPHASADTVISDARDSVHVIKLNARVKVGVLSLPASLDFGAVSVGACKDTTFNLGNVGNDTLQVTKQSFGLPNFTLVRPPLPITIAPGGVVTVTLEYCSTDTGSVQTGDTMRVDNRTTLRVMILHAHSGYGILGALQPIDFGTVDVGSCKDTTVQLRNIGTDTLTLTIPPTFTQGFTVPAGQLPLVIPPGSSRPITFRYCPSDTLPHSSSDSLRAKFPGNGKPITLLGKGIRGILTTPNAIDFGCIIVGQTLQQTVVLKNVGPASVGNVKAVVIGSSDLTILRAPGNSIGANASDSVIVQLTATTLGSLSASIEVTSTGSTVEIPVTAHVSVKPQLVVLDTLLNYDTVTVGDSVTLCIRVMNPSCAGLDVKDLSIASTHNGVFHVSQVSTPKIIADSAVTQLCITFAPTQNAHEEGFVTFVLDSGAAPGVHLIGQGAAPIIGVHPLALDFGDVLVTTTSAAQTVEVVNLGLALAQSGTPSIVGPNAAEFAFTGAARAIGRNDSIAYSLTMTPATVGTKQAWFVIPIAGKLDSVLLTGRGVQPGILVTRQRIDFGKVDVNPAPLPQQTFVIRNTGTSPLTVNSLALTGDPSFTFVQVPTGSVTLAQATDSILVTVSFNPTTTGIKSGQISINNTTSDQPIVDLAGIGVKAVLAVSVDTVNFGSVYLGSAKDSIAAITITNTGYGKALTLTNSTAAGTNPGDFSVQIPAQGTLQPGESRTFDARFTPQAIGLREADLQLTTDIIGGGGGKVHLIGNGLSNGTTVVLYSDTVIAKMGSTVNLPVKIDKDVTISNATQLHFRVQFDPSFLDLGSVGAGSGLPAGSQVTMTKNSVGDASVTITTPTPIHGPGTIATLALELLVGPTSSSAVQFVSADFGTSAASIGTRNQGLILGQQCDTSAHVVLSAEPVSVTQNSPNPFNPRTTVNVTVRQLGNIRLLVYDALGREVQRPLDKTLDVGEYPIVIDGSALASGGYHYIVEWSWNGVVKREMKSMQLVK